jgi:DNA recombination-dependent growth factor C
MFKIIQEEINLLVKQAIIVTKLELEHLNCLQDVFENKILIKKADYKKADLIRDKLNSIYPVYLELLAKYTTNN